MIPDLSGAAWRKSSYSGGNGGECIELAFVGEKLVVRDSKNTEGDVLAFGADAWRQFLFAAKDNRFSG